jgi:Fe-S-cluster containining protein
MADIDRPQPTLHEALAGRRQLKADEEFSFACHNGLGCFGKCCADVNIFLTPLDVLKLARRIGKTTTEVLDQHTMMPITKDLHLPVVMLKMLGEDEGKRCPFVDENGCTVYEDRPWSCRMYPVGMGVPPSRAGEEPEPIYVLFEDDLCEGFTEKKTWTVRQWLADQGVHRGDELDKGFQEVVSHPWFIGGTRQLDPKKIEMFHMASYDVDRFRRFVFDSTFLDRFEVEEELVEKMRDDDLALLGFAFRWLRFALFGEPTITVRESAHQPGRNP